MAKNDQIFKSTFFNCFCPKGKKLYLESFLCANNALTKNFLFIILTMTSSFLGYSFVSGPFGGLKNVSGDIFGQTDSFVSFTKNIRISSKNLLFSKG